MRIYQFDAKAAGRRVDRFESKQLTISHLLKGDHLQVVCVYLGSGGVIGRHPSVGHQFFFVVEGSGVVAGAKGEEREIHPGLVAEWMPGEEHETRTTDGLTAFVVEGTSVEIIHLRPF